MIQPHAFVEVHDLIRPHPPGVRRFEVPDVESHIAWLIKRVTTKYPHINERSVVGWLRGMVYLNEYLFLHLPNSVALFEAIRPSPFSPVTVVWERWVWAKDKDSIEEAIAFYPRAKQWAGHLDARSIIVGEASDVPLPLIEEALESKALEKRHKFIRLVEKT